MPVIPLTVANLARRDEAVRPHDYRTPRSRTTKIEFDLVAIGSHLIDGYPGSATGAQNLVMDEVIDGIAADEQSYKAAQAGDRSDGGEQAASRSNTRIVSWQCNADDAPIGWRML